MGCSQIRKVTYPPDFVYIEKDQIRSHMANFSLDIWQINDVLSNNGVLAGNAREQIIGLLKDMEERALKLSGGSGRQTNHLLIDENIDEFKESVRAARLAVEAEPPGYYLVGQLSGKCLSCHKLR